VKNGLNRLTGQKVIVMTESTRNKKTIKVIRWLLLAAAASFVCFFALRYMWKRGYFLPGWIQWKENSEDHTFTVGYDPGFKEVSRASRKKMAQTSNDDLEYISEIVNVSLEDKKIRIETSDGVLLWESDDEWLVSDYLIGDIDHDDEDELVLLVWKIGSYGEYKPIWVKEDENKWSEHIFIYDYEPTEESRIYPIWMSSKIGIEAKSISLDSDEKLHIMLPEDKESVWYWESWGLTLLE